ncbi:hypothetical protein [Halorussus amylolyticus]|uniref:hypothetical protein n=1 Tax=Halorussus amylolyticus TaxID=1126242 RepID=UPI00104CB7F6|nr:hypothetical protein [Halorussus amylolyticus]
MAGKHKRARCVFVVVLVCWSAVAPATAASAATQDSSPETADEYLESLRALEGQEAFEEYSEFEVVRAQAVSAVQVGEFTDAKADRMALVYDVLVSFDEAYELSQSGERAESIDRANETEARLEELRSAGGSQYAALTSIALDRFYQNQGETLHDEALAANDTRVALELMGSAATAYQRGGAVEEYSNLVVQRESLQSTYESDVETVNESVAAADAFFADCGESCTSPVGALTTHTVSVFDHYADARTASDRLGTASEATAEHGLSDRSETVGTMSERAQSTVFSLAVASVILAVGFALVVALVAMVVAHRLSAWAKDVEDSQIGDIVLTEEVVHG